MGKFDYRVACRIKENGDVDYITVLVSYNKDGSISHFTSTPTYPFGKDIEEYTFNMELYQKALDKPVLDLVFTEEGVRMLEAKGD